MSTATAAPTYEGIADLVVERLALAGAVRGRGPAPWDAFLRLSELVHAGFEVPSTTLTPMMRRLLFALGWAARPRRIAAAGSYAGYCLAFLLRDHHDADQGPFAETATGIDVDAAASAVAARNCSVLGHGSALRFVCGDAIELLGRDGDEIDLLYLDIDDAVTGKRGYAAVLEAALPRLADGALVLAHDASVPKFAADFRRYHREVARAPRLRGPWVLPVDACGLSVVVAQGATC